MSSVRVLVYDIGGTSLRAALYCAETDSLTEVNQTHTPNHRTFPQASGAELKQRLIDAVIRLGRSILKDTPADAVSLAFPGPIDPQGNVLAAPTIWGDRWREAVDLRQSLANHLPAARLLVLNDVTAAGYRYLRHREEDLCVVTVGSGIGHKVFIRGRVTVGPHGFGGEIGHVRMNTSPDAPWCDCGHRGHLGALASGRATSSQVQQYVAQKAQAFAASALGHRVGGDPSRVDNRLIVEYSHQGDAWTLGLIRRMVNPLGQALALLHLGVGVERFVIVGGFALALGEPYRRALVGAAAESTWNHAGDWNSMIELGAQDDDSGMIGAGRYAAFYAEAES